MKFNTTGAAVLGAFISIAIAAQVPAFAQQPSPEEVSPIISAGSAAFGTLLAGRIAADQITVHGIDMGKLTENLINLLGSKQVMFSRGELQAVIDSARVDHPLTMAKPQPPSQPSAPEKGAQQK